MELIDFQSLDNLHFKKSFLATPSFSIVDITAPNASQPLNIPTPYSHPIHPDIIYFPNGFNGYKYWMVVSPYDDSSHENPCIVVSNDGTTWEQPPGITNPIATPTEGHLRDPEIIYGLDNKLHVLYGQFAEYGPDYTSYLLMVDSTDGIHWSDPIVLDSSPHRDTYTSPAVIIDNGKYKLYYVENVRTNNCNKILMREVSDLLDISSAQEQLVTVSSSDNILCQYGGPKDPWHLNVIKYNGIYYMLLTICAKYQNGAGARLRFAVSYDGINWVMENHDIISVGPSGSWDDYLIYRSTFLPYEDTNGLRFKIWYSGDGSTSNRWYTGYTESSPLSAKIPSFKKIILDIGNYNKVKIIIDTIIDKILIPKIDQFKLILKQIPNNSSWQSNSYYFVNQWISVNGYQYKCIQEGISGSTPPTWITTRDSTIVDNGVIWKCTSKSITFPYNVIFPNDSNKHTLELPLKENSVTVLTFVYDKEEDKIYVTSINNYES